LFCQYQPSFELTKLRAKKIAAKILGLRNIRRYSLLENENFSLIDKNGARFNLDDVLFLNFRLKMSQFSEPLKMTLCSMREDKNG
jgi:hypothetical protein